MIRSAAVVILMVLLPSAFADDCREHTSCQQCLRNNGKQSVRHCMWCSSTERCASNVSDLACSRAHRISDGSNCKAKNSSDGYAAYNDKFGRVMMALSAAAYSFNVEKCLENVIPGAKMKRQITVRCDEAKVDTCSGYTAVSPGNRVIVVSFRGTNSFVQLMIEAGATAFEKKFAFPGGGKVGRYFYDAFYSVWMAGLKDDFLTLHSQHPNYEVWITGHSLGAAMASIAAGTIVSLGLAPANQIKLVTFGEPRTGDMQFAEAVDKALIYSHRVTHKQDMVAHLPPRNFENYYHHRYEVWYNNDMSEGSSYVECVDSDSDHCSDSDIDLSIDDHTHYFGRSFSQFGEAGCV